MELIPELMKLLRTKSMIRYFPPNGTAGFARSFVRGYSRVPLPPASTIPSTRSCIRRIVSQSLCYVDPVNARRWLIVGLLNLGVVIAYVDRTNLSVALTVPDFRNHFHLTDQDRGALNSAFFWSYALLQIPAGWVVDKYGVKLPY